MIQLEDLIHNLRIDLEVPFKGKSALFVDVKNFTKFCGQSFFRPTEYYFNGRCYSILLPDCLLELGILEMVFNFKNKGNKMTKIIQCNVKYCLIFKETSSFIININIIRQTAEQELILLQDFTRRLPSIMR